MLGSELLRWNGSTELFARGNAALRRRHAMLPGLLLHGGFDQPNLSPSLQYERRLHHGLLRGAKRQRSASVHGSVVLPAAVARLVLGPPNI